jgi:hypothetical protein
VVGLHKFSLLASFFTCYTIIVFIPIKSQLQAIHFPLWSREDPISYCLLNETTPSDSGFCVNHHLLPTQLP